MGMRRRWLQGLGALVSALAVTALSGCVTMTDMRAEVSTFGDWPAGRTGGTYAFGDTRQQTLGCLGRVAGVLQELQLTLEDLVGARVYLVADPRIGRMDFEGFNAAWSEFFGQRATRFPSRTVLQVAGLVNAGWLLEIEPLAARERA